MKQRKGYKTCKWFGHNFQHIEIDFLSDDLAKRIFEERKTFFVLYCRKCGEVRDER